MQNVFEEKSGGVEYLLSPITANLNATLTKVRMSVRVCIG
jgi:hypothetical protein